MDGLDAHLEHIHKLKAEEKYDECLKLCNELLATDPQLSQLLYERAWVYRRTDKKSRAIQDLTAAIRLNPKEPAFHHFAGRWELESGNCENALGHLSACIEVEIAISDEYYLGESYMLSAIANEHLGRLPEALELLQHVDDTHVTFVNELYRGGDLRRRIQSRIPR